MADKKKFDKIIPNPNYKDDGTNDTFQATPNRQKVKKTNVYSFRPAMRKKAAVKVYEVGKIPVYYVFIACFALCLINAVLRNMGAYNNVPEHTEYIIKCLTYPIAFLIPIIVYCKKQRRPFADSCCLHAFSPLFISFIILAFLLLTLIIAAQRFSISYFFPYTLQQQQIDLFSKDDKIGAIIAYALLPAIFEELLIRGLIQTEISKKAGGLTGIIISCIVFALIHLDIKHFIIYLSSGLLLGIVTHVTGSVIPSMIIHSLNNTFSLLFSSRLTFIASERVGNMFVLIILILFIFAVLLFFLKVLENICIKKSVCAEIHSGKADKRTKGNCSSLLLKNRLPIKLSSDTGFTLHKLLRHLFSPAIIVCFILFLMYTFL